MRLLRLLQTAKQSTTAMNKPELLAPAGDAECLAAALQFGADAVYVGAKHYGMRAAAKNFDIPALHEAVQQAHAQGVITATTAREGLPLTPEQRAYENKGELEAGTLGSSDTILQADEPDQKAEVVVGE